MKELQDKLNAIDAETLVNIDKKHNILDVMYDFSGYVQMCNKELVAIKQALSQYIGEDINPLTDAQKRTLRLGGDTLGDIRKMIKASKERKDREVFNANFIKKA